tara:strand:- start:200 stop:325 length:126 start_codon:yes stop_codon:yes gene_type:complete
MVKVNKTKIKTEYKYFALLSILNFFLIKLDKEKITNKTKDE